MSLIFFVAASACLQYLSNKILILVESGTVFSFQTFTVNLVGFKKYQQIGFKQMEHVKSTTVSSSKSTQQRKMPPYLERFRRVALYSE